MNLSEILKDFRIIENECPITCPRNLNLSLKDLGNPQRILGQGNKPDDDVDNDDDETKGRSKKGKKKRNDNATTTLVSTVAETAESRKTRTFQSKGGESEMNIATDTNTTNEKITVQEINYDKV